MKRLELPPGTIVVGGSSSKCAGCGRETLVDGVTHHRDVSGYQPQPGGGCGVEFTHIHPSYLGTDRLVADMRPDLTLIPAGGSGLTQRGGPNV